MPREAGQDRTSDSPFRLTAERLGQFADRRIAEQDSYLRAVADAIDDDVGDAFSNRYYVLNDGPVKTIDLRVKVVTSNAIGAAIDIGLRMMLGRHGLEDKHDYALIESVLPNMKAELLEHKVDLIPLRMCCSLRRMRWAVPRSCS